MGQLQSLRAQRQTPLIGPDLEIVGFDDTKLQLAVVSDQITGETSQPGPNMSSKPSMHIICMALPPISTIKTENEAGGVVQDKRTSAKDNKPK